MFLGSSPGLDLQAWQHGVVLNYSRPGKPTDNAFAEAFNSRVRQECLNAYWFLSLDDARCKIELWRVECNAVATHRDRTSAPADHRDCWPKCPVNRKPDFIASGSPRSGQAQFNPGLYS